MVNPCFQHFFCCFVILWHTVEGWVAVGAVAASFLLVGVFGLASTSSSFPARATSLCWLESLFHSHIVLRLDVGVVRFVIGGGNVDVRGVCGCVTFTRFSFVCMIILSIRRCVPLALSMWLTCRGEMVATLRRKVSACPSVCTIPAKMIASEIVK